MDEDRLSPRGGEKALDSTCSPSNPRTTDRVYTSMLGDVLAELLASVVGELAPEGVAPIIVALVLVLACVAFAALGSFVTYQVFTQQARPAQGLLALLLFGLSAGSGRLALKAFRSR